MLHCTAPHPFEKWHSRRRAIVCRWRMSGMEGPTGSAPRLLRRCRWDVGDRMRAVGSRGDNQVGLSWQPWDKGMTDVEEAVRSGAETHSFGGVWYERSGWLSGFKNETSCRSALSFFLDWSLHRTCDVIDRHDGLHAALVGEGSIGARSALAPSDVLKCLTFCQKSKSARAFIL